MIVAATNRDGMNDVDGDWGGVAVYYNHNSSRAVDGQSVFPGRPFQSIHLFSPNFKGFCDGGLAAS